MGLFLGVQPPNMAWLMVEPFIGFLLLFWCEFTRLPRVLMGDALRRFCFCVTFLTLCPGHGQAEVYVVG